MCSLSPQLDSLLKEFFQARHLKMKEQPHLPHFAQWHVIARDESSLK